jgi:hypothetical protein
MFCARVELVLDDLALEGALLVEATVIRPGESDQSKHAM